MMLEVRGLNQHYGQSHTLRDLSLDVPAAACTCVMGRNGVGKTTLLDTLMGLLPASSGSLSYAGRGEPVELSGLPPERRAGLGIGYVPQGRMIFPQLTVLENLAVGLPASGLDRVPDAVYDLFPVLRDMAGRRGGDLSGGQQQQLAIGRALVLEPQLLILDEPCEGIAPNIVRQIGDAITFLNRERGVTVLLVEQKLPFARRVADRFAILERGTVVAADAMSALDDGLIDRFLKV